MKIRIAIPVSNGKLSEHCGDCQYFVVVEITDSGVCYCGEFSLMNVDVKSVSEWLDTTGVTDLITYRVEPPLLNHLLACKLSLFIGVPVESPAELIDKYLQGKLESDEQVIREIYGTEQKTDE